MTAKSITAALFWRLRPSTEIMIPRFTPAHWWECDLWRLMDSRMIAEYEIKLSVADYRKDFEKDQDIRIKDGNFWCRTTHKERKHDLLAARDTRGPNRFWFVLADDVAAKVEIPAYAGLMVARAYGSAVSVAIKKQAPVLHREKWNGDVNTIAKTFYWRFWHQEAKG